MLIGGESARKLIQRKLIQYKEKILSLFLFCVQTNTIGGKPITKVPVVPGAGTNNITGMGKLKCMAYFHVEMDRYHSLNQRKHGRITIVTSTEGRLSSTSMVEYMGHIIRRR